MGNSARSKGRTDPAVAGWMSQERDDGKRCAMGGVAGTPAALLTARPGERQQQAEFQLTEGIASASATSRRG